MPTPKVDRRARVTSRKEADKRHDVGTPNKRPATGERKETGRRNAAPGFADRHPFLSLAFAIVGALALIAVFTPTGESGQSDGRPVAVFMPTGENGQSDEWPVAVIQNNSDTARLDSLQEDVDILAQALIDAQAEPTTTPEPTPVATPCEAPTLVACGEHPTPNPDAGQTEELCHSVTALMRTVSQGFDPNGELPTSAMLSKLGKVNNAICTASVSATDQELCLAINVAVDAVFEQADKEPNVLSLEQMDTLRIVSSTICA